MNAPRLANIARTALVPRRGFGSTTPGLPQVRVSLGEKLVHGVVIFCGVLAYPVWVVSHMKEYKGQA
uniref:Protein with signal anchor n=1 Tax=Culex tarsalis TaxID=7177 RepID=A0A1Q3FMB2_CULTA